MTQKHHPMQPAYIDESGRPRFLENKIISFLVKHLKLGEDTSLNALTMHDLIIKENEGRNAGFSQEDWEQFYQLIGYSLSGYMELNLVGDRSYQKAGEMYDSLMKMKEAQDARG